MKAEHCIIVSCYIAVTTICKKAEIRRKREKIQQMTRGGKGSACHLFPLSWCWGRERARERDFPDTKSKRKFRITFFQVAYLCEAQEELLQANAFIGPLFCICTFLSGIFPTVTFFVCGTFLLTVWGEKQKKLDEKQRNLWTLSIETDCDWMVLWTLQQS